jgi:ABC-2 type transport system ATP-binding protein
MAEVSGTPPALVLTDLYRAFDGLVAVDGLSLEVARGEVLGLLGPNGAGKTTTIRCICGLLWPDAGEILIDGVRLQDDPRGLRRRLGLCPQELVVWEHLTCLEQLVFTGRLYDLDRETAHRRAMGLLEDLGLADRASSPARTLSGGMQRRLNIALALVHDPELVVLDEPQAGLDPQSRVLVREYLRSLAADRTVLVTTHDMEEADRLSDRVAIIDHGRLLVLDRPEALKSSLGEGDLLEIALPAALPDTVDRMLAGAGPETEGLTRHGDRLRLVDRQVHRRLPGLLEHLGRHGLEAEEITIRRRTLEDVFIALTGRGLRE